MRGDTFAPDRAEIALPKPYNDLCDADEPPGSSGHVLACGPCRIARTCAGIICRAPESTGEIIPAEYLAGNKPNGRRCVELIRGYNMIYQANKRRLGRWKALHTGAPSIIIPLRGLA